MTNTYVKGFISGSSNGKMVVVSASSSPGTIVHTAISGSANKEEVWIYGTNRHTSNVGLIIEWGGTSSADQIPLSLQPGAGLNLLVPGLPLNNSLVVRAYVSASSTINLINLVGFTNQIISG